MSDEKKNDFELSEEFLNDIRKDTDVNEFNLKEELRTVINKTQRYVEELYKQKRKLKQLERYVKKVRSEMYQEIKDVGYKGLEINNTSDINMIIDGDKRYQTARKYLDEIVCVVEFLETTVKTMTNKSFTLQRLVELEKINL